MSQWRQQYIFFFFQAEDGIRDLTVTGVQTCALPILQRQQARGEAHGEAGVDGGQVGRAEARVDLAGPGPEQAVARHGVDRKSTRLNSSHSQISYAVFCLKKKKHTTKVCHAHTVYT